MSERSKALIEALGNSVLTLDGAMGTMIQRTMPDDADFEMVTSGGERVRGCNDVLCVTRPDLIAGIHREYIAAGARIIETNSFNSNAISLSEYGLSSEARRLNLAAAGLACGVARESDIMVWVAGSVGPTGKSLSMEQGLDASDAVDFDTLVSAYIVQMEALIEGGVDLLIVETIFDGINARAAALALQEAMTRAGRRVPVIISATLTDQGRLLSGQTAEALFASVAHIRPLAVGFNCTFGIDGMLPFIESVQGIGTYLVAYPNAGLPNAMGKYDETPDLMAEKMRPILQRGLLNIVGGCCGTTPDHIKAIAALAAEAKPRVVPERAAGETRLAGLDVLSMPAKGCFVKVGERCNVAGSRKFLRLVRERKYDEAVAVAAAQIKAGADIIDLNVDDAMLDARQEMRRMLVALQGNPATARVPVMIDSSDWEVIKEALKLVQGRPVVNSISLKEGEAVFLEKARHIARMGGAMVVMAFDEEGQADTFERKTEVCGRAYRLLTEEADIEPSDIIFDPNILAIGTGIDAHRRYAADFIEAVGWIKDNLPGARVSGGLSNLSFAFRGNNQLREAIHAVFLNRATAKGMDMAIVNPSTMVDASAVDTPLREAVDDLLLDRRDDATERLIDIAPKPAEKKTTAAAGATADEKMGVGERLSLMIESGSADGIEPLLDEAVAELGTAMAVINGPLMGGMNRVGELFGQGEMFLPQVVKSASVMKVAVEHLSPLLEVKNEAGEDSSPRILLATVKGDVHDIGKNIVGVIMQSNGFKVIDLGVMVPCEQILERAKAERVDCIGLSGLITPSLGEMCHVAEAMEREGLTMPLFVGGAAASAEHTAVYIAPRYSGVAVYTHDAATLPVVARRILDPATSRQACREVRCGQQALRQRYDASSGPRTDLAESRRLRPEVDYGRKAPAPFRPGEHTFDIEVAQAREWINARAFFSAWKLDASFAAMTEVGGCDHCRAQWLAGVDPESRRKASEAMQLWKEAQRMLDAMVSRGATLKARVVLADACSDDGDMIHIIGPDGTTVEVATLRNAEPDESGCCVALSDFIAPEADHIGLFAVTTGEQLRQYQSSMTDDYRRMLAASLCDRLVEAATEIMHHRVRKSLWGYAPLEGCEPRRLLRADYQGIRPAFGYPSLPDQSLVFEADKLLRYSELGIELTGNGALRPQSTTTGLILAHPDSRYFAVGKLSDEAKADYARRRGMNEAEMKKFLIK